MGTSRRSQDVCKYPNLGKPRGICGQLLKGQGRWRWCTIHWHRIIDERAPLYSWTYRRRKIFEAKASPLLRRAVTNRREFRRMAAVLGLAAIPPAQRPRRELPKHPSDRYARAVREFKKFRLRTLREGTHPALRDDIYNARNRLSPPASLDALWLWASFEHLAIGLGGRDARDLARRAIQLGDLYLGKGEPLLAADAYLLYANLHRVLHLSAIAAHRPVSAARHRQKAQTMLDRLAGLLDGLTARFLYRTDASFRYRVDFRRHHVERLIVILALDAGEPAHALRRRDRLIRFSTESGSDVAVYEARVVLADAQASTDKVTAEDQLDELDGCERDFPRFAEFPLLTRRLVATRIHCYKILGNTERAEELAIGVYAPAVGRDQIHFAVDELKRSGIDPAILGRPQYRATGIWASFAEGMSL